MIAQTPWFERKFEFDFPVGLFPVIIERLRGTLARLENLLKGIQEDKLTAKQADAWSIKEQVGHLYDLEDLWYGRVEDFLAQAPVLRAADITNAKTKSSGHNSKKINQLLHEFANAREKLLSKVENVDESTASITSIHPRLQKPMRLVDSLFFVAEHDDHHLAKIRELIHSLLPDEDTGEDFNEYDTSEEVTEKEELISRLLESKDLYKQAQSIAHVGNWAWDVKENKVTWSEELYRIFGADPGIEIDYQTYVSDDLS